MSLVEEELDMLEKRKKVEGPRVPVLPRYTCIARVH